MARVLYALARIQAVPRLLTKRITRMARVLAWLAPCTIALQCSTFPTIDSGQCGNGVIEGGEDCDTFPRFGRVCRAPGASGACRLDCSPHSDGSRDRCPVGTGCGNDGICRRATGQFTLASSFEVGAVAALGSGDFDGDGRGDVLSREPTDTILQSRFRLHYFDDNARLVETLPFAPCILVTFSLDGSIVNASAITFSVGTYTSQGGNDALALGTDDFSSQWSFWHVPGLDRRDPTPIRLAGELPLGAFPIQGPASQRALSASNASADLDGDGLDESIWMLPSLAGDSCVVAVLNVDAVAQRLLSRSLLLEGKPCLDARLAARDMDGDGARDLVLLTDRDSSQQSLQVLWNDGAGTFSLSATTTLTAPTAARIRDFTVLGEPRTRLVFATSTGLYSALSSEQGRGFDAPLQLQVLSSGEAVTAADVNGDGVDDLVLTDARGLTVLRAELSP